MPTGFDFNIVVPMAGLGTRFVSSKYTEPKPFIKINGKHMIEYVLRNLNVPKARFLLIVRPQHFRNYKQFFRKICNEYDCTVLEAQNTDGACESVLMAEDLINNETPLIIANSDQLIDISLLEFIKDSGKRELDGSILVFPSSESKWCYVQIDTNGMVQRVKEKDVISDKAAVGIFFFLKGYLFGRYAKEMIIKHYKIAGEYFVSTTFNYAIKDGHRIGAYNIEKDEMHCLGTPKDLNIFLNKKIIY